MEYKQVILVRMDLDLSIGKLAAQVSHASLDAALAAKKDILIEWRKGGAKKVVLQVADLDELTAYKQKADAAKIANALISDAGHTEVPSGTVTCLAIGPDKEAEINKITGALRML